jgi:hypothetical protein
MPAFLATQESEIRRITVRGQPRQTLSQKKKKKPYLKKTPSHTQKKRAGGVAQDEGPEFKPQ